MHLVALVESADHVCCRYRLKAFQAGLSAAGHELELRELPDQWWERWRLGGELQHTDGVIVQRKLLPGLQVTALRSRVKRLIFDFDDAVFLRDSFSAKGLQSPRRERRFGVMIRNADAVVAGNDWLAEQARGAGGNGIVAVIPTCIDPMAYPVGRSGSPEGVKDLSPGRTPWVSDQRGSSPEGAIEPLSPLQGLHDDVDLSPGLPPWANIDRPFGAEETTSPIVVGGRLVWIGSSSTVQGLEAIRPLLENLGREIPGLTLKLICDRFLTLENLLVEKCPWSEATEGAALAAADIGIAWVPDDQWSRGKCGLKVLQYMAAGLPVVANPVGVHTDLVRHGETGFLAETPDEWRDSIRQLLNDPEMRRRMGTAGRQLVEQDYSVSVGLDRWVALIGRLSEERARRAG